MAEFLLLMHSLKDGEATSDATWDAYLGRLAASGVMRGGSAIGGGEAFRKTGAAPAITAHLDGYIKIEASDLDAAKTWLAGNPVYEAGGVVEIRELPVTG